MDSGLAALAAIRNDERTGRLPFVIPGPRVSAEPGIQGDLRQDRRCKTGKHVKRSPGPPLPGGTDAAIYLKRAGDAGGADSLGGLTDFLATDFFRATASPGAAVFSSASLAIRSALSRAIFSRTALAATS